MAKNDKALQNKIDHICKVLFLTEEGKPKSPTLLYSFCMALVAIAVHFFVYVFLIDMLEEAFSFASAGVRYMVELLIPALAGGAVCALLSLLFRERKGLVPAAYTWFAVIVLMLAVAAAFNCDWSDKALEYRIFWRALGLPAVFSVLCGGGMSYLVYRKRMRK